MAESVRICEVCDRTLISTCIPPSLGGVPIHFAVTEDMYAAGMQLKREDCMSPRSSTALDVLPSGNLRL